ncbi:MAG: molybdopterin-dependent oxidoreductase, partial [Micropruina sp.]
AALVTGGAGQLLSTRTPPGVTTLPRPSIPLPQLPAGVEASVPGLSPWVTPNADFYRVDVNLIVPAIDHTSWSLTIDGMVERPYQLGWSDLIGLELIERDITMTCVSNEVGGSYLGSARWLGVRTRDVLQRAGIDRLADQVLSTAVDGFTISTPLAALLDDRDALVAIGINGRPLPPEHGYPVRLVTPGLYGFVGSTKWLTRLTLTTYVAQQAYWTQRGWATDAPVKPSSRIESPRPLQPIRPGSTVIGGTAWAQRRGIAAVEVRIDSGPWRRARLGPTAGIDYWRQWYLPWEATTGNHTLECRAVDGAGQVQSDQREAPFPDGSSGIQQVVVVVR